MLSLVRYRCQLFSSRTYYKRGGINKMMTGYKDKGSVKKTKNKMFTLLMDEDEFEDMKKASEVDKRNMSQIARDGIKKEIRRLKDE